METKNTVSKSKKDVQDVKIDVDVAEMKIFSPKGGKLDTVVNKGRLETLTYVDDITGKQTIINFDDLLIENVSIDGKMLSVVTLIEDPSKPLDDVLKISQSHGINTLKNTVAGAKNNRISGKISVSIDEYETLFTARQGQRKGFSTEVNIHDFGIIKHLLTDKFAKLIDVIFYNLDKQGGYSVSFPVYQYMEYRGMKISESNVDKAYRELKKLLKALFNFSVTSIEGKRSYMYIRPFSKAGVKNGDIHVNFEKDFVDSINKRYFEMPKGTGTLKPTAYNMASYLFIYARKAVKSEFTLMNETLYEYSGLPRYEEVNSKDRAITQKIIEPFQKALYEISEKLGEHIDIIEQEFEPNCWEAFLKSKVKIRLPKIQHTVIALKKARKKRMPKAKKDKQE